MAGIEVEEFAFDYLIFFPGRVLWLMSASISIRPMESKKYTELKSKTEAEFLTPCKICFTFKRHEKSLQTFL